MPNQSAAMALRKESASASECKSSEKNRYSRTALGDRSWIDKVLSRAELILRDSEKATRHFVLSVGTSRDIGNTKGSNQWEQNPHTVQLLRSATKRCALML